MPRLFSSSLRNVLVSGAAAIAVAAGTGATFAMWADEGGAMFRTMVETGLAWCF